VFSMAPHCTVSVKTTSGWALFDADFGPSSTDSTHRSISQKATGTTFTNLCSRQGERWSSEEPQPSNAATSP